MPWIGRLFSFGSGLLASVAFALGGLSQLIAPHSFPAWLGQGPIRILALPVWLNHSPSAGSAAKAGAAASVRTAARAMARMEVPRGLDSRRSLALLREPGVNVVILATVRPRAAHPAATGRG